MNQQQPLSSNVRLLPVASLRARPVHRSGIWRITSVLVAAVATLCLLANSLGFVNAADVDNAQPTLPTIDVLIDGVPMTVEVAATNQQRYMGLSFRPSMAENDGMLFVYQAERPLSFTMRNTLIPLSIAFISKDLVINEIHHMDVGPGQIFDSEQKAQYALEVNQGWFAKQGIKPGAKIVMQ